MKLGVVSPLPNPRQLLVFVGFSLVDITQLTNYHGNPQPSFSGAKGSYYHTIFRYQVIRFPWSWSQKSYPSLFDAVLLREGNFHQARGHEELQELPFFGGEDQTNRPLNLLVTLFPWFCPKNIALFGGWCNISWTRVEKLGGDVKTDLGDFFQPTKFTAAKYAYFHGTLLGPVPDTSTSPTFFTGLWIQPWSHNNPVIRPAIS